MLGDARKAAADGAESDRRLKNSLPNSLPAGNKADRPPRIDRWDFAFRQRRTRRSCRGSAAATPSPLVGEGWGGGSGGCGNAVPPLAEPPPHPPPPPTRWGGGGGGVGRGVCGNPVPPLATPTPDPSPQGGGEEFASPPQLKLASMRVGVRGADFPHAQTRGDAPSPGAQERADLSPQAGR